MGLSKALYRRRVLVILVLALFALFLLFRRSEPATAADNQPVHMEAAKKMQVANLNEVPLRDGFIKDPTEYFVQSTLRDNHVVIFSKPECPHCRAAKALLQWYRDQRGLRYIVIEMSSEKDLQGIRQALKSLYQRTTFPSIFIDVQCVGGNEELQQLEGSGQLAQMLTDKGLLTALLADRPANAAAAPEAAAKDKVKVVEPVNEPVKTPANEPANQAMQQEEQAQKPAPSAAERKVRTLIKKHRVMVFSKTYCPYSRRAKQLLSQYHDGRGLEFTVLEADLEADPMEIKAALGAVSGHFTFPNVFVDGKSIGGSDDLAAIHANGELALLLKEKSLIV
ncbi:thioredoxin-like protein [Kickxella alabastrina]|uniref:thioredoxin-like protein n=1 Tax=Kickxella alabastrina TaxID=61397 RepID=UPI00221F8300|nr:thioredoxin-like protein [Kickxella alabastrina]KAI7825804.1 thioredoxin-like protein [Kickxella alabastrina]KAJ1941409.1 hypothetical protein GGF37_003566 [Kickxella alabastrina]